MRPSRKDKLKVLGVICARGGSKGLPGKNIRLLAGKPLIAYTIEAALGAPGLSRCVVSTDDPQIARVAREHGGVVPFMRPDYLARDEAKLYEPLRHAVEWVEENEDWSPDLVMGLQATTPLRTAEDIEESIDILIRHDADSVVGYAPAKQHPYWMKKITEDGRLKEFMPFDPAYLRRQILPQVYHVSGSMYLYKRDLLMNHESIYTDKTYPLVVPVERAIDIDTYDDFRVAEMILKEQGVGVLI